MSRISMVPTDRPAAQREGLLSLARALVGAHHGGTFSETLEIVTETLGAEAAAAYEAEPEGLVLVAHRGLSMELRTALERLPRSEEPWFIASRAAKTRRIAIDPDVVASTASPDVAKLFPAGPRLLGAAVPLVAGREVLGVLVLFHRRSGRGIEGRRRGRGRAFAERRGGRRGDAAPPGADRAGEVDGDAPPAPAALLAIAVDGLGGE